MCHLCPNKMYKWSCSGQGTDFQSSVYHLSMRTTCWGKCLAFLIYFVSLSWSLSLKMVLAMATSGICWDLRTSLGHNQHCKDNKKDKPRTSWGQKNDVRSIAPTESKMLKNYFPLNVVVPDPQKPLLIKSSVLISWTWIKAKYGGYLSFCKTKKTGFDFFYF